MRVRASAHDAGALAAFRGRHVYPTEVASPTSMYPTVERTPWGIVALVLGIIGLGGVGTIIAGAVSKENLVRDIVIGILQLIIPFVGWIWGLVWGILIFVKSY